jgi:hypothetical protein
MLIDQLMESVLVTQTGVIQTGSTQWTTSPATHVATTLEFAIIFALADVQDQLNPTVLTVSRRLISLEALVSVNQSGTATNVSSTMASALAPAMAVMDQMLTSATSVLKTQPATSMESVFVSQSGLMIIVLLTLLVIQFVPGAIQTSDSLVKDQAQLNVTPVLKMPTETGKVLVNASMAGVAQTVLCGTESVIQSVTSIAMVQLHLTA